MNAVNRKTISIGLLKFALSLLVLVFIQIAANAQSYTQEEQNCFDQVQNKVAYDQLGTKTWNPVNVRKLCKGTTDAAATISCFKNIISSFNDWNRGITECVGTQTKAEDVKITRTITIKNNSGINLYGYLVGRSNYATRNNTGNLKSGIAGTKQIAYGQTEKFGESTSLPLSEDVELWIEQADSLKPYFISTLPKNKDLTTFCYEITGTYFVPFVKTCDGSPTYESKYISFKNEAGYNSTMSLTYYPTGDSTPKTAKTISTTAGYQTKLYLPLDADTSKQMTLKVEQTSDTGNNEMLTKNVDLSSFDTVGSTCYKVWGSIFSKKVNLCSENPNARTIKLKNNGAFQARMEVTYYDGETPKMVKSNPLEVLESDIVEVPNTSAKNPIKIRFLAYGKEFNTTTASANFSGELCYKLEGTALAPTSATCDDTVGDTSGNTRQIRFQNDSGYDAQMIVTYFVDEVINGNKIPMPKTLTTGMINGLGGKFRLVTIPKDTSKGMPITIALQGNATVKGNDAIFSTTLDANFAASPQPCFKVTGTLFDPSGGKCNQ
ncbi:MAG TPA: hypothetical protein PKY59_26495 [Pyrinomonadaceae bacterium]|nr:hypothetical protein [Pyrinomonadaceae bacterium]